jgi:putative ABC transport system substrate-binding protein
MEMIVKTKSKPVSFCPGSPLAVLLLLWVYFVSAAGGAEAARREKEAGPKPWRLGVLFWHDSPNDLAALEGIQEAFKESGRPFHAVIKQADSDRQKAIAILKAFQSEPVNLIFAMGTQAALLAAEFVPKIPVVFTAVTNPVESKVVESWKGSGRNLAGNSNWIESKTVLHIFQMAVPNLSRLGILRSKNSGVVSAAELRAMKDYLGEPGAPPLTIVEEVVQSAIDIRGATKKLLASKVQALWIPIDFLIYENMKEVLAAVPPAVLPLVSSSLKGMKTGAVAGVVVDYKMLGKRAAVIAFDILEKGISPGSIPIGTVKGYQVIVNLEAARHSNYELPLSILVLADSIVQETTSEENNHEK